MIAMTEQELRDLPVAVDLETAGRAFGLGRTKSHELARAGEFPCPVLRFGRKYRVTRSDLFRALGAPAIPGVLKEEKSAGAIAPDAGTTPPAAPVPGGGTRVLLVLEAVMYPADSPEIPR